VKTLSYGSWPSPISAASLSAAAAKPVAIVTDGMDVWWAESRPVEGGRVALVRWRDGDIEEMSPPGADVRSAVHEYGGGAWWVDAGTLYWVEFDDQQVRMRASDGTVTLLTPEPRTRASVRYADLRPVPGAGLLVAVRETHEAREEPANELVSIATDGSGRVDVLATGADFYAAPRPSPDGGHLAWLQWNHPDMPWDATELWEGTLHDGELVGRVLLAGGGDEAIAQPEWAPNGELHFVSDRTGRSALHRRLEDGSIVVEVGGEFDVGLPTWEFDQSRYAIDPDGHLVVAMRRPRADAILFDRSGRVDGGWTEVRHVRALPDGRVAYIGANARLDRVVVIHGDSPEIVSTPPVHGVAPGYLPEPEPITFATTDDEVAHAHFYRPANPRVEAPGDELPPLLVLVHGGPTSAAWRGLDLGIRYWTSRGWAVVDVDYRGSAGHGRDYMHSLRGRWGVADVDDCVAAAQFLESRGDVDPNRLAIKGGSAGGLTVLAALAFHDVFAAGASRYGIGDLMTLAADTHKFESRYMDRLVGPLPGAEELMGERSPINHTHRMNAPVIFLHGGADRVVPPNQAEAMVDELAARGIPHAHVVFDAEGHGFRSAEARTRALEAEYSFFAQIFGFEPADDLERVEIRDPDGGP
jgi:dipeptidyl aminopeptidase/acylaminoacyl peptidase